MSRLAVVGGGRMGRALVGGLLRSGILQPDELFIAEANEETREELGRRFPGVEVAEHVPKVDSAVLAVKPLDAEAACAGLASSGASRVVSIIAGVRIAVLEEYLGSRPVVLRAMPNVPAVLGAAASGLAGSDRASEDDFAWAECVLSSVGVVARVPERLLDVVTGLSGSGPAYVLLLAEAMVEGGVAGGLDREVSRLLTNQTLLGTARLLNELGESPEELRGRVTSPGGTTAAGLRVLESHSLRSALIEAVLAASERARELGAEHD